MSYSCKVNSKGQITIPSQIRKQLDIKEDDILLAEITEKGAIILDGGKELIINKNTEELITLLNETFAIMKKREKVEGGLARESDSC